MLYSFDVFDTIIGRRTIIPEGVYSVMQERMMASEYFKEYVGMTRITQFTRLRKKAEIINSNSKIFPVTHIDEIYRILCWMMGSVSFDTVTRIKQLEIDTECRMAFGITRNINSINELIRNNEKVILISDMYLTSENIRDILSSVDYKLGELPIYVSSEWNCTKRDGGLYHKVMENEHIPFGAWVHVGDDEIGDEMVPSLLGINTKKFTIGRKLDIEEYVVSEYKKRKDMSCLGIGVARKLRLQNGWTSYESIGGYVGGAVIFSYTLWVVEEALRGEIERLLFVSRDGYILKQVADIIIREKGYAITTEYVYGSRKAWRETEKAKKANAVAYIMSIMRDSKCAFVDLQSSGMSLDLLLEDIDEISNVPYFIYGFDYNKSLKKIRPYVFDEVSRNISMEVFCRAPHGVTKGYEMIDGQIVPIVGEWNNNLENNQQKEFEKGVTDYTAELLKVLNDLGITGCWKEYNAIICEYINSMKDKTLNDYIGDIIHDSGEKENEEKYSPVLTKEDLDRIGLIGEVVFKSKYYTGANYDLSLRRTNVLINEVGFSQFEQYNTFVGDVTKKRILLYTAGKQGKKYYELLKNLKDIEIVGWTDIKAEEYKKTGLPVINIKDVASIDRDYVLVPMHREGAPFKNIVTFLKNIGFEDIYLSEEDICEYIYSVISKTNERSDSIL